MCTIVLSKDTKWESQCTADKCIPCVCLFVCVCVALKEHLFMLHSDRETHTDVKLSPLEGVFQRENMSKKKDLHGENRI